MILYRNKKRGRRVRIGGPSKMGGVSDVSVRDLHDAELYPPGPILQFNLGDEREFSLELNSQEADRLLSRLIIFLDKHPIPDVCGNCQGTGVDSSEGRPDLFCEQCEMGRAKIRAALKNGPVTHAEITASKGSAT